MTGSNPAHLGRKILRFGSFTEELILCLLLLLMIGFACLQIVLRSVFSGGLLWIDPLLRYLVLWSGLLGGAMATSRGSHIALDLAGYLVPPLLKPYITCICHLFSFITSGFLSYASILFIQGEIEFPLPGLFGVPSWGWGLIFPLAFILITLRYLLLLIQDLRSIAQPSSANQQGVQ